MIEELNELKRCSLFAEFSQIELEKVISVAHKETIIPGDHAFHENEEGDNLIIIRLGTLRLMKIDTGGDAKQLALLGTGSYVGEMALFDEGLRSASGVAVERCDIWKIPYSELRELLENNVGMAAKFYKSMARGISRRLNYLNEDFMALKKFLKSRD
ncbi:MAG: cyclic nucleotide-binding domain-containing protein [Calditrichaeota bacterium]|nr:MAG: cyclic nucleotide-binding domain-containing protein [Calditrichota bacterium]